MTTASLAMCILSLWAAVIDAALLAIAFGWPKIPGLPADAKR